LGLLPQGNSSVKQKRGDFLRQPSAGGKEKGRHTLFMRRTGNRFSMHRLTEEKKKGNG